MNYTEQLQKSFYSQRIGTIYGCFEVTEVQYDAEQKRQLWTLRCVYCGAVKQTYNGKDYAKGKNHGICKCRHTKKPISKNPPKNKKELMREHPLYSRWKSIKSRCYQKSCKDYFNYGGRGIAMCDAWRYDFWEFANWAKDNGYEDGLTIDRIDNDKGYSPENCRWIPRGDQNKNKRNIQLYDGLTLPDWCVEHGISYSRVSADLQHGVPFDEAVKSAESKRKADEFVAACRARGVRPDKIKRRMEKGLSFQDAVEFKGNMRKRQYAMGGVQKPLSEWCSEYGISCPAVEYRMKKMGMSFREAITTPKKQPPQKSRKK